MSRILYNLNVKPLPSWTDRCVEALGRAVFLGRDSRFVVQRTAILRRAELEKLLSGKAGRSAEELAERGRGLRLLGRADEARPLLREAAKRGCPAGKGWLWELEKKDQPELLAAAMKAEPKEGRWRLWHAIRIAIVAGEKAVADARAAAELGADPALCLLVEALGRLQERLPAEAEKAALRALELDPSVEWGWRTLADARVALGRRGEALEAMDRALRLNEGLHTLTPLVEQHVPSHDAHAAIKILDEELEKKPDLWWAYALRADFRRYPELNDHVGAFEDMKRCLDLKPDSPWALAYMTRCQISVGDWAGARRSIDRAVELDPECGWIAAWKGEHQRRAGETKAALETLDRAMSLDPDYEFTYAWRGGALRALGRAREAVADLGIAIELDPPYVEWSFFERMHAHRALGDTERALADLERAHAVNGKYVWDAEPKKLASGLAELEKFLKRSPKNGLGWLWRGDVLIRLRRFEDADAALGRACRLRPKDGEAFVLRGRARGELGRWKDAFSDFDRAVKLDKKSGAAAAWRGRARLLTGKLAPALKDLERACELDKGAVWMLAWKAEALHGLGRFEEALAAADTALALHPRYGEAAAWRGAALCRLGRWDEGFAELDRAEGLARGVLDRLGPERAALERERPAPPPPPAPDAAAEADLLVRSGRHEEAANLLAGLIARAPDDAELRLKRAEALRCCGRYEDAVAEWDSLLKLRPGASSLCSRGESKRHCFDFEGALADAEAALKAEPGDAGAWVLKSEAERGLGRLDAAAESAKRAAEADPHWSWAPVVLAKVLRQAGKLAEAEAPLAAAEAKGDPYAWAWRADVRRKAGRLEEALKDAQAAVTARPTIAWYRAERGEILRQLGRAAEGWADVEEAVRIDGRCSCDYDFIGSEASQSASDPQRAWVFAWRGAIHRREGRLDAAKADFDRAASLDPSCFWAVSWRAELALQQGRLDDALADLERALKEHAAFVPALLWSGQALLLSGRAADALPRYRKAAELSPLEPWAHVGVGASLEALGRASEAASAFGRARELAPALFEGIAR